MNIVCLAGDLIPTKLGGAEMHVVEVVKRLARKNHIYLFVGANTSIETEFTQNISVHPLHYPKIPNLSELSFILFSIPQLVWFFIRHKPSCDVIWAKQCFPQAPLAIMLKYLYHKPVYVTVQNPLLLRQELVVSSWLTPIQQFLASILEPLIKHSLRYANCSACVSQYSAKEAKKFGAKNIVIIPNGVDSKLLLRYQFKPYKRHGILQIVSTSSLIPRNGLDTLIQSLSYLPTSIKFHLTIAGSGPEQAKLQNLVKSLNLHSNVSLNGRLSNASVAKLLSTAHLMIRPSRWEGFGVSFIEAMAVGVPVIATPVGGITDFISNRQTGLLVPPDKPKALAQAILELAKHPDLAHKLSQNAHKLIAQQYTWDTIASQVESQLVKLASENKPKLVPILRKV